jgi:lipopolysaccharide/colanic/teichoic acid biosynthesis glycosyltransferase
MRRDSGASRFAEPSDAEEQQTLGSGSNWVQALTDPAYRRRTERPRDRFCRCGDLAIAMGVLVFTFPLMLTVALILWFEGAGSILVWQHRMGSDGRLVTILRFRTTAAFPAGTDWFPRNQRTHVGEVLWRTHLDALPMLINVLRGEMTVLGTGNRARLR